MDDALNSIMASPNLMAGYRRKLASLPAHLAFHLTNLPPVAAYMERRHVDSLRRNLCVASPLPHEAAIVAGLHREGVVVTDLDALGLTELGDDGEIMVSAGRIARRLGEVAAAMGTARPPMIVSQMADLIRDPAVYRWGLNAVLLRIAENYLHQPVAYDGPLVFHSSEDGREVGTRRWHLDREDRRVIKVALYLNDVDDSGCPFQLLKQEVQHEGDRFDYSVFQGAEMQQKFGAEVLTADTSTCTGKAGTVIFADTARFYHRAKPSTGRDRSAIFFSYFARPPCHPFFCNRNHLPRQQIVQLTEGLNRAQRACALWQDNVSWVVRQIPESPT